MIIYVNENYCILALDDAPSEYAQTFNVTQTRAEMFGDYCDAVIRGFKYEPQYKLLFNDDGSNQIDETTGELLYNVDNDGNKIPNGYLLYPFVDINTIDMVQSNYRLLLEINAQIEYLSMMSGIETEVADE